MEAKQAPRGFAAWTPERRKELASKAGKLSHAVGKAHKFTSEEAAAAGRIGGRRVSENRMHMAEIGRKGGLNKSKAKKESST
jgi:general stress protein YciG